MSFPASEFAMPDLICSCYTNTNTNTIAYSASDAVTKYQICSRRPSLTLRAHDHYHAVRLCMQWSGRIGLLSLGGRTIKHTWTHLRNHTFIRRVCSRNCKSHCQSSKCRRVTGLSAISLIAERLSLQ